MTIPTPGETKKPILKHLSKATKPVKISHITESMGKHFNLSKREIEEQMPKGGRRFATKVGVAVEEMKSSGLVKSTGRGFVEITAQGRTGLQEGTITRKKPGRKAKSPANGRKKRGKPGRPPKAKVKSANGRRKLGRPKSKVATNGRRKLGRPAKSQTGITQPSVTPIKQDDKMVQRTTDIVMSYVGKNSVRAKEVPGLIESIYGTLSGLGTSSKPVGKRKYTRRKKVAKKA